MMHGCGIHSRVYRAEMYTGRELVPMGPVEMGSRPNYVVKWEWEEHGNGSVGISGNENTMSSHFPPTSS